MSVKGGGRGGTGISEGGGREAWPCSQAEQVETGDGQYGTWPTRTSTEKASTIFDPLTLQQLVTTGLPSWITLPRGPAPNATLPPLPPFLP